MEVPKYRFHSRHPQQIETIAGQDTLSVGIPFPSNNQAYLSAVASRESSNNIRNRRAHRSTPQLSKSWSRRPAARAVESASTGALNVTKRDRPVLDAERPIDSALDMKSLDSSMVCDSYPFLARSRALPIDSRIFVVMADLL